FIQPGLRLPTRIFPMTAGPLMLDLEGTSLCAEYKALLRHPNVGGVIYFARNVASPEQVLALSREIAAIRPELLIAVDQEGGRVQRFRDRKSVGEGKSVGGGGRPPLE